MFDFVSVARKIDRTSNFAWAMSDNILFYLSLIQICSMACAGINSLRIIEFSFSFL